MSSVDLVHWGGLDRISNLEQSLKALENGGVYSSLSVHAYTPEAYGAVGDGVTNDTAAWQACIDAAYAGGANCVIRCGHFSYAFESAPRHDRTGNAILALPAAGGAHLRIAIEGMPGGTQFYTHVTGQAYSASYGPPSLIGGPTVEQTGTSFPGQFSNVEIRLNNIEVYVLGDDTVSGIDLGGIDYAIIGNVECYGLGSASTTPSSVWQFGMRLPEGLNSGNVRVGRLRCNGFYAGLVANTSHLAADSLFLSRGVVGFAITGNNQFSGNDGHASVITYLLTQNCNYHIASWDPSVGVESLPSNKPAMLRVVAHDIEDASSGWSATTDHVLDANSQLYGESHYMRNLANTGPVSGLTVSGAKNFDCYDFRGYRGASREQIRQKASGVITENMHPGAPSGTAAFTSQQVNGFLVGLRAGDVVTGIAVRVAVAATGTNPTTVRVGLADSTGKVLVLSGNLNTSALQATGAAQLAFSAAYTVPTDGGYFALVFVNGTWGTTQPTVIKSGATTAAYSALSGALLPSIGIAAQSDLPSVGASLSSITTPIGFSPWVGLY